MFNGIFKNRKMMTVIVIVLVGGIAYVTADLSLRVKKQSMRIEALTKMNDNQMLLSEEKGRLLVIKDSVIAKQSYIINQKDSLLKNTKPVTTIKYPSFIKDDSIIVIDKIPCFKSNKSGDSNTGYFCYQYNGKLYYSITLTIDDLGPNRIKSPKYFFKNRPIK